MKRLDKWLDDIADLHQNRKHDQELEALILNTPTELWGGGQTVGSAPIGIQPNGTEMFIHFGNQDNNILPYISASFDLQGVEPPPPTSVPEPSTLALMGLVLLGMASRRKAKSY